MLAAHADLDYREWGVSATARRSWPPAQILWAAGRTVLGIGSRGNARPTTHRKRLNQTSRPGARRHRHTAAGPSLSRTRSRPQRNCAGTRHRAAPGLPGGWRQRPRRQLQPRTRGRIGGRSCHRICNGADAEVGRTRPRPMAMRPGCGCAGGRYWLYIGRATGPELHETAARPAGFFGRTCASLVAPQAAAEARRRGC